MNLSPTPKRGCAADRTACARYARQERAKFPHLHGGWTRREWNHQVTNATENRLTRLIAIRKADARDEYRCEELAAGFDSRHEHETEEMDLSRACDQRRGFI